MFETRFRIREEELTPEERGVDEDAQAMEYRVEYRPWYWPFWRDAGAPWICSMEEAQAVVAAAKAALVKPKVTYHYVP